MEGGGGGRNSTPQQDLSLFGYFSRVIMGESSDILYHAKKFTDDVKNVLYWNDPPPTNLYSMKEEDFGCLTTLLITSAIQQEEAERKQRRQLQRLRRDEQDRNRIKQQEQSHKLTFEAASTPNSPVLPLVGVVTTVSATNTLSRDTSNSSSSSSHEVVTTTRTRSLSTTFTIDTEDTLPHRSPSANLLEDPTFITNLIRREHLYKPKSTASPSSPSTALAITPSSSNTLQQQQQQQQFSITRTITTTTTADSTQSTTISSTIAFSTPSTNSPPPAATRSEGRKIRSKEYIEKLQSQLERANQCKTCFDSEKTHMFLDCGHFGWCEQCANEVNKCPVCYVPVTKRVRVYNC